CTPRPEITCCICGSRRREAAGSPTFRPSAAGDRCARRKASAFRCASTPLCSSTRGAIRTARRCGSSSTTVPGTVPGAARGRDARGSSLADAGRTRISSRPTEERCPWHFYLTDGCTTVPPGVSRPRGKHCPSCFTKCRGRRCSAIAGLHEAPHERIAEAVGPGFHVAGELTAKRLVGRDRDRQIVPAGEAAQRPARRHGLARRERSIDAAPPKPKADVRSPATARRHGVMFDSIRNRTVLLHTSGDVVSASRNCETYDAP